MAKRSSKDIEEFLNENLEFDSETDESELYDSDADPGYHPSGNNTTNNPVQSRTLPLPSPISSSDDESLSENSGDSSVDESDNNTWSETYADIPEFNFDRNSVGVQFEITDNARDNPNEIFKQFWTDEITELIVSSINKYGDKLTILDCPHKKGSRTTNFQKTSFEDVQNF